MANRRQSKLTKRTGAVKPASRKAKTSTQAKRTASARPRQAQPKRLVFAFEAGRADGNVSMRAVLGGKGANLAEMAALGLPVPPGFTISTDVCTYFDTHGKRYPEGLEAEVKKQLARVEKNLGRRFGDPKNPLLVSVRS